MDIRSTFFGRGTVLEAGDVSEQNRQCLRRVGLSYRQKQTTSKHIYNGDGVKAERSRQWTDCAGDSSATWGVRRVR